MSFPELDIWASGMVFLLFFRPYVFCWNCLTTFATSMSFSYSSLSRHFLSTIVVIKFDISNSMFNSAKSHSFSNSSNFSQWSSGVSLAVCFAQKNLILSCICFFSASTTCYIVFYFVYFDIVGVGSVFRSCYWVRWFGSTCSQNILLYFFLFSVPLVGCSHVFFCN